MGTVFISLDEKRGVSNIALILLRMETNFRGGEAENFARPRGRATKLLGQNPSFFMHSHEPLFIVVKGDIHGIFQNILFPFIVFTLEDLI